jgi:hypothetical protein
VKLAEILFFGGIQGLASIRSGEGGVRESRLEGQRSTASHVAAPGGCLHVRWVEAALEGAATGDQRPVETCCSQRYRRRPHRVEHLFIKDHNASAGGLILEVSVIPSTPSLPLGVTLTWLNSPAQKALSADWLCIGAWLDARNRSLVVINGRINWRKGTNN